MKSAAAKPEPPRWTMEQMVAYCDQAVRDGRHSRALRTMCDGCREWVGSIMHVTLDKKRMCPKCYEKLINPPR